MMNRRRFFEALTAAMLAVLVIGAGFALAAPPNGKGPNKDGGGGGDDGGTPDPPPLTFLITWLPEEFRADEFNNQGDAIGKVATTAADGGVSSGALFHNGVVYDINGFVNDPAWNIYLVKDISDRNGGYFYVAGIGLFDGIARGCRLTFGEAENGGPPVLVETLKLEPLPGDSRSGAAAVNSSGNVIVMSKSAEDVLHEIYFYDAETGQQVRGGASWQSSDTYHARLNEQDVLLHHYEDSTTGEIRVLMWDPATNWWESWGGDRTAEAINNFGEFCGGRRIEVKSKGNKTTTTRVPYVFNGIEFSEFSGYYGDSLDANGWGANALDLNDAGDVLLTPDRIYISEYAQIFNVWTMLDPANSDADINELSRYSHVSTHQLNDLRFILGRSRYYDSDRSEYVHRSFYLVPVSW